jgi:hypothetical protein
MQYMNALEEYLKTSIDSLQTDLGVPADTIAADINAIKTSVDAFQGLAVTDSPTFSAITTSLTQTAPTISADLKSTVTKGSGWTGTSPYTHTSGTSVLSYEITGGVAANEYVIVNLTATGGSITFNCKVSLGTSTSDTSGIVLADDIFVSSATVLSVKSDNTYTHLNIIPDNSFSGTIVVSYIKKFTQLNIKSGSIQDYDIVVPSISSMAIGNGLYVNNSGDYNTAFGKYSLYYCYTGDNNTAFGYNSQKYTSIGNNNTSFGYGTLNNNNSGSDNVAIGSLALPASKSGDGNIAIGVTTLYSNISGIGNLGIGYASLFSNIGEGSSLGSYNIAIGSYSLQYVVNGLKNVAVGYNSGLNYGSGGDNCTASTNSIFIGYDSRPLANTQDNQIVIGYMGRGQGSNTITIGNSSISTLYVGATLYLNQAVTTTSSPTFTTLSINAATDTDSTLTFKENTTTKWTLRNESDDDSFNIKTGSLDMFKISSAGDISIGTGNVNIGSGTLSTWSTDAKSIEFYDSAIMARNSNSSIYILSNAYYNAANTWRYKISSVNTALYLQSIGVHTFAVASGSGKSAGDEITWSTMLTINSTGLSYSGNLMDATSRIQNMYLGTKSFTHAVSNQKVDIEIPNGSNTYRLEILLGSIWSNSNVNVSQKVIFDINTESGGSIHTSTRNQIDISLNQIGKFNIGNLRWDASKSKFVITISNLDNEGNPIYVSAKLFNYYTALYLSDFVLSDVYIDATDRVALNVHRFSSTVNIGGGTTSSVSATYNMLEFFNSNITTNGGGHYTSLNTNNYRNISNQWVYKISSLQATKYYNENGTHVFQVAPAGTADSEITWLTALTIDNNAVSTFSCDGTSYAQIRAYDTRSQAIGTGGSISFRGKYKDDGTTTDCGSIQAYKESATTNNYSFGMEFFTRLNGASPSRTLYLAADKSATFAGTITSSATIPTSAVGGIYLKQNTDPSVFSTADQIGIYATAGENSTLGLVTEQAIVTEAVTSDSTLTVKINGTAYKLCLKA